MDTPQELITACMKGKAWAQETLYLKYKSRLMGIAMRYAGSREHAQDILQEGFVRILTHCHKYNDRGSFEGWMTRIIINTAITFNRKWDYRRNELPEEHEEWIDGEVMADRQLQEKDLLRMVQALPPGYRTIFNLYVIDGYSHEEIAKELNISESTSKTQLMKAKKKLAQQLVRYEQMDKAL